MIDTSVAVIIPANGSLTQVVDSSLTGFVAGYPQITSGSECISSAVGDAGKKALVIETTATTGTAEITVKYTKGGDTHTRVYTVTVMKELEKSVEWITEGDKARITISCTRTRESAGDTPNVLFLGSLCGAHGLEPGTVKDTINSILTVANVDYYLYGAYYTVKNNSLKQEGKLDQGQTFTLDPTVYNTTKDQLNTGYHTSVYYFARIISEMSAADLKEYDLIVMEFDGLRMGFLKKEFEDLDSAGYQKLTGSSSYNSESALHQLALDAAMKLKTFYEDEKVAWLVPQAQDGSGRDDYTYGYYFMYDDKGLFDTGYDSYTVMYDALGLLDPEDWLNSAGTAKDTAKFNAVKSQSTSSAKKNFIINNFPKFVERCTGDKTNTSPLFTMSGSTKGKMWARYGQAEAVKELINQKKEEISHYAKVDLKDVIAQGFQVVESEITAEYFMDSVWNPVPADKYTVTVTGNTVTANFKLKDIGSDQVRLEIPIIATSEVEYGGSSGTQGEAKTNNGVEAVYDGDEDSKVTGEDPTIKESRLRVTKTVIKLNGEAWLGTTPPPVKAGDVLTYSITVENLSDTKTITDITVTDELLGYTTTTPFDLGPGESKTLDDLTATHTVTAAEVAAGKVTNKAIATGTIDSDTITGKREVSDTAPGLKVVKEVSNSPTLPVKAGDVIKYEVTVSNTGDVPITDVSVTDELSGATLNTAEYPLDVATGIDLAAAGDSEGKDKVTLHYIYTVSNLDIQNVGGTDKIVNTVNASGTVERPTENGGNFTVSGTDTEETTAQKPAISFTVDKDHTTAAGANIGEHITYEIVIENNGGEAITHIEITDAKAIPSPHTILLKDDSDAEIVIAPGHSYTKTLDYVVTYEDIEAGTIHNEASVKAQLVSDSGTTKTVSDTDDYTPATKDPKLFMEKSIDHITDSLNNMMPSDHVPNTGDKIYYKITVTNIGNVTVNNIIIEDELTQNTVAAGTQLSIASLTPGTSGSVVTSPYIIKEEDVIAGHKLNFVTAKGTGAGGSGSPYAYDEYDTMIQSAGPSLFVEKSAQIGDGSKTVADIGDMITYTVTVTNNGNVTVNNVTVTDSLTEKGATLKSGDADTVTYIAPGDSYVVHYVYTVTAADLVAGSVYNSATASGTPVAGDIEGHITPGTETTPTNMPKIAVEGTKTWNDGDNQDGLRPAAITVKLYARTTEIDSKTVTAADGWHYIFTPLDMYDASGVIPYSIKEENVPYYTAEYDGYNITNSHDPGVTSVTVTKVWDDNDNSDGVRPDSVTVNLFGDGFKVKSHAVTAADGWTYTFKYLDMYSAGMLIEYTITEDSVEGYETTIDKFTVTNKRVGEKVNISGEKTWADEDDKEGKRPDSITIRLLAGGTEVANKTVTAADGWKWTFDGMPKYADGVEIVYTITEDSVEGYSAEITGFNVKNTYDAEEGGGGGETPPDVKPPMPTEPPEDAEYWMDDPDLPMGFWEWDEEEDEWVWIETDYLPQTGSLFWPIPVLALAGIALITAGVVIRRRKNVGGAR